MGKKCLTCGCEFNINGKYCGKCTYDYFMKKVEVMEDKIVEYRKRAILIRQSDCEHSFVGKIFQGERSKYQRCSKCNKTQDI